MSKSDEQVVEEFDEAVNMSRKELEEWLETEESKEVGQKDGGGESKGHESGRKIVEILGKNESDYTDEDIDHLRRVVSYVHRHQAQTPKGDVEDSNWRYSLMNWGHDPLKRLPECVCYVLGLVPCRSLAGKPWRGSVLLLPALSFRHPRLALAVCRLR
jgi:Protein of unknown function (DUF3140)